MLMFLHPQIPDFQIVVSRTNPNKLSYPNKPYIIGKRIYSAFRWCINLNLKKNYPYDWFVVQGHILWDLS